MVTDSSTSFGGSGELREARQLAAALRGDRSSFCELIDVVSVTTFSLIAIHVGDQPTMRRVFVDVVRQAFDTLGERDRSVSGWTWFCRLALSHARAARATDGVSGPGVMFTQQSSGLAGPIGQLPPGTAAMLYLRYITRSSTLEIARVFQVTAAAASQRLYDAVNVLDRSERMQREHPNRYRPRAPSPDPEGVSVECEDARRRMHLLRDRALDREAQIEMRAHVSRCQVCLDADARIVFAEKALRGVLLEVGPSPRRLRRFLRAEVARFPVKPRLFERLVTTVKWAKRRLLRERPPRRRRTEREIQTEGRGDDRLR